MTMLRFLALLTVAALAAIGTGRPIRLGNKRDHRIAVEGDPKLFNQYGIVLVNPDRHPNVKAEPGRQFVDWILSEEGQSAIASFQVDGQQLFFPNSGS